MALAQALLSSDWLGSNEQSWPFAIDWVHREAMGLEELTIAAPIGMIDLVSGLTGARSGTADPGQVNEFGGVDAYFDGSGDRYIISGNPVFDTSLDFTIVWECSLESFIDETAMIALFYSASGNAAALQYHSGSASDIALFDDVTLLARVAKPENVSMTERHWGVWSYTAGVGHRVWINGDSCTANGTATFSAKTNSRRIGGSNAATDDFNGGIRQVRRYSRAWSQEEAFAFWDPATRDSVLLGFRHRPTLVSNLHAAAAGISVASGSAQITASYALAAVGIALAGGTASLTGSVSLNAAGASFSAGAAAAVAAAELIASGISECAGQAYLALDALLVAFGVAECLGSAALLRRDNRINYLNQKAIMVGSNNNLFVRL